MRYKGKEIGNPEVWQIAEYIALKGYRLSAQAVYDKYNAKGWVNYKGKPIKSLEAIVDSQNGVMLHKERKAEKKAQRKALKRQKRQELLGKVLKNTRDRERKTPHKHIPYKKQLKDKRWRELRREVIEERGGKCEMCGSSSNLCVHHKAYIKGRYAWEYPKDYLLVLCNGCHRKIHGIDLDERAEFLIEND